MRGQSGRRDQFITIQKRPTSKSSSGANIQATDPEVVTTAWARIRPAGGRPESYAADTLSASVRYMVEIDYFPGLDETTEIAWGTRTLDVIQVPDPGPRPQIMTLIAEERR